MNTYQIKGLSFSYPEQEQPALKQMDLTIEQGAFVVLCGSSGSGKSTLLRQLKPLLAPHGKRTGTILFEGRPVEQMDQRMQSQQIGFVMQSPDNQIVTDKVWHELAFGLESLGVPSIEIRRRVAEMASFFGIQNWFYKDVQTLSGGQKQILNLAAVMVLQPHVLILDEPTSQLDPIAASDFLSMLSKINKELGTTIIITEHHLEEVMALATMVVVMEQGSLLCAGTPQQVGQYLKDAGHHMFQAMPAAMQIWAAVENDLPCPLTVRDGRDWLQRYAEDHELYPLPPASIPHSAGPAVIKMEEVWYGYDKGTPDVIKGLSLTVKQGEFLALLGSNGTGKTTSLKLLQGLLKPDRGTIQLTGIVGLLPQNPQALFIGKTVWEDLQELFATSSLPQEEQQVRLQQVISLCRLSHLLQRHPYDLSGGEQQRAALAKILLLEPQILLLDEPSKSLDAQFAQTLAQILQQLLQKGITIVMVSHDIEFCAHYAHRCALFFDGAIVAEDTPRKFFSGNRFYTTAANRMARTMLPEAVTTDDVILACGGRPPTPPELPQITVSVPTNEPSSKPDKKLPWWKRCGAVLSGAVIVVLLIRFLFLTDMTTLIQANGFTMLSFRQIWLYVMFLAAILIFAGCTGKLQGQQPIKKQRLPKRTKAAVLCILLFIPITLLWGQYYLEGRKYYLIAVLVLLECMLPFFLLFEGRRPQARELVVIAVLCAIGVAGRAVFYMLPQFKPVLAFTIIAGVAFGAETGFLVGAMTMLASNILFSQGPWTPWQMFAMGISGFLAGLLFSRGPLSRQKISLCLFGALAAILIYGGIMNPASALLWSSGLNWKLLLTYYITGFPMDCIHAAATVFFLWFASEPMLEKLERVKIKYGLVEYREEQER